MTNLPPSPYGPADPTAQGPQSPYSAPQPSGVAEYDPRQQPQHGYTAGGPTPPERGQGLGRAAFIIGIASMVAAFIPIVNVLSFALGPVGVVLGGIAWAQAGRPRAQPIWGLALSAVSMLVSFVMIFVFTFGALFTLGMTVESAPALETVVAIALGA
ncbi:hypothetical protein [Mycetocola zhadangensis]|uniref:DUF4190 domain-containing protein n=1 Tax=Mycetocola zhadangensis TaxID=1164595 RepID=A0A3L7J128_9MICO|nr:hypothetical protein [Mycetocola zhadangensis]RLQ84203.1 hypothetical protein D9V28_08265 [Mycetocola zhadangensis]